MGVKTPAHADDGGNNEYLVGVVKGIELNDEFDTRTSTSDRTRCLGRRHNVKVVMQVNQF